MKIVEINLARTWRGGERQTLYTAAALAAAGHDVYVLARTNSPLAIHCKQQSLQVVELSGGAALGNWLMAKGKNAEILHCQGSKELTWCVITKWVHKRPVVLSRRVNFVPKGNLTRWKYQQATAIVGISEAIRQTLEKFGIPNIKVIPSAFLPQTPDPARIEALKSKYNPGHRKIVATAAAFTAEKDPATMLAAIKKLASLRKDFIFLHFGTGPLLPKIAGEIKSQGLESVYYLPGHISGIEALFPAFDVFVMSSAEEGLGSSVLDAFYYEVPVVSTAAGGLKFLLAENRGCLCPVSDAGCLAEQIHKILNDPAAFRKMTEKSKEYLLEKHSIPNCTSQYENLFKSLLSTS